MSDPTRPSRCLVAPASVGDVCTVVTRSVVDEPVRILAIRDEFVSRDFDLPGEWWPAEPGVIGGRDQRAGGSWCVSDVATGTTALVLNRTERQTGTPSRGVLPLAAVSAGDAWPDRIAHRAMASFNLVLAGPAGVTVSTWDTERLRRTGLPPGIHMFTSRGIDTDDPKTTTFAPRFATEEWLSVVTSCEPIDEIGALVVRRAVDADVYATVFGQLITAAPGALTIAHSRTPWQPGTWVEQHWPS
jgi:uncharacterized protein with NRDE domain